MDDSEKVREALLSAAYRDSLITGERTWLLSNEAFMTVLEHFGWTVKNIDPGPSGSQQP